VLLCCMPGRSRGAAQHPPVRGLALCPFFRSVQVLSEHYNPFAPARVCPTLKSTPRMRSSLGSFRSLSLSVAHGRRRPKVLVPFWDCAAAAALVAATCSSSEWLSLQHVSGRSLPRARPQSISVKCYRK